MAHARVTRAGSAGLNAPRRERRIETWVAEFDLSQTLVTKKERENRLLEGS